jgi:hypothetical protein
MQNTSINRQQQQKHVFFSLGFHEFKIRYFNKNAMNKKAKSNYIILSTTNDNDSCQLDYSTIFLWKKYYQIKIWQSRTRVEQDTMSFCYSMIQSNLKNVI